MKSLKYLMVAASITGLLLTAPMAISQEPINNVDNVEEKTTTPYELVRNIETALQLRDVIKNNENVAIDLGATWCGPCIRYIPIFEKVAKEYNGKVVFGKVVLDKLADKEYREIIEQYQVRSIPRTMLFKNGEKVYDRLGVIKEKELSQLVSSYLLENKK